MRSALGVLLTLFTLFPATASATESDSYTWRDQYRADFTEAFNARINSWLDEAADLWNSAPGSPSLQFKDQDKPPRYYLRALKAKTSREVLFTSLAADHAIDRGMPDRLEKFANSADPAYRMELGNHSIYAAMRPDAFRGLVVVGLLGVMPWSCDQLFVSGIRVGVDKFGHFNSEGFKYYDLVKREQKTLEYALREGERWEREYFGIQVSGIYSNADLVANREGYDKWLNILETVERPNRATLTPLFHMEESGKVVRLRPFDARDHFTALFDEVYNPSRFSPGAWSYMRKALRKKICPLYNAHPELFVQATLQQLKATYPDVRFSQLPHQTLAAACAD